MFATHQWYHSRNFGSARLGASGSAVSCTNGELLLSDAIMWTFTTIESTALQAKLIQTVRKSAAECSVFHSNSAVIFGSSTSTSISKKVVPYSITSVGLRADPGFLAVSLQVTLVINPVVGCRYFPPGPQLLSQPKRSPLLAGTKLYCLMTEAHRCKWLAQGHYAMVPSQDLNPRPVNCKSVALKMHRITTSTVPEVKVQVPVKVTSGQFV